MEYIEHDEGICAEIRWKNAKIVFSKTTHRGTLLEFVQRPKFGLSCFMNGSIQSCLSDEMGYHKCLTENIVRKGRVAIFGGGEGATARELLKKVSGTAVEHIDMFEWDYDVVDIFRTQFPEWANGAWNDSRLHIHNFDIFEHILTIPDNFYDAVVVDLFEPNDQTDDKWKELFTHMFRIMKKGGTFSIYAGMRPLNNDLQVQSKMRTMLCDVGFFNALTHTGDFILSFLGKPIFICGSKLDYQEWLLGLESDSE